MRRQDTAAVSSFRHLRYHSDPHIHLVQSGVSVSCSMTSRVGRKPDAHPLIRNNVHAIWPLPITVASRSITRRDVGVSADRPQSTCHRPRRVSRGSRGDGFHLVTGLRADDRIGDESMTSIRVTRCGSGRSPWPRCERRAGLGVGELEAVRVRGDDSRVRRGASQFIRLAVTRERCPIPVELDPGASRGTRVGGRPGRGSTPLPRASIR